jgi:hypothetical protein
MIIEQLLEKGFKVHGALGSEYEESGRKNKAHSSGGHRPLV